MRKLVPRGVVVKFVSVVAPIFAVALAWLGDLRELSTAAVISGAVGISVAAYMCALKWEISREICDSLSVCSLVESIEDEEVYERGRLTIGECQVELETCLRRFCG